MNDPWYVVVFGVGLAAITQLALLGFIAIKLKRRFFVENIKASEKQLEVLNSQEFREFLRSNISFKITDAEVKRFIEIESNNIKVEAVNARGRFYFNLFPRRLIARRMQVEFENISISQVVEVLIAEEKYINSTFGREESKKNILFAVASLFFILGMFGLILLLSKFF